MKKKESEWIIEGLLKKNATNIMNVYHDDDCDLMKVSTKPCNCNPDIAVGIVKNKEKK